MKYTIWLLVGSLAGGLNAVYGLADRLPRSFVSF